MNTKKALKEKYKQLQPTMGIFQILNKENRKILIEGSTDISAKWNRHKTELKFGSHRNKSLQSDWNKFGEERFEFCILSELEIKEDDNFNIAEEIKILKDMVLEELNIKQDLKY